MKKNYTKPAMAVLSISANDMLCSGCGAGALNKNEFVDILLSVYDTNGDGRLDREDFGLTDFGQVEGCETVPKDLEFYCKHTAVNTAFWS